MTDNIISDNIVALNRDRETAVIQCGYGRTMFFKDPYKNLTFVHFADIHAVLPLWNRMVEYMNHYGDYIDFALHTGDYCGDRQEAYVDFYKDGTKTDKVIYNCVGNHDTVTTPQWIRNTKESAHALLFNHTENWGASFQDIPHAMNYYKDFPEANIRLIVLDLYYDQDLQKAWLADLLQRSMAEGVSVITAMHEPSAEITEHLDTPFCSILEENGEYRRIAGGFQEHTYEETIADFIAAGGKYICNLCGHLHHDLFGYTQKGVLNIAVECATSWYHWCDSRRVPGTRTWDAFNVMAVDVNQQLIKLVRIGDDTDCFMRQKRTLCYDYGKKCLVYSG